MKDDKPAYPNADSNNCPEWAEKDGEGARQSLLGMVHQPKVIDPLHELNLLRMMQMANERTARELGPLPPGGLPVQEERKPAAPCMDFFGCFVPDVQPILEESDEMKLRQVAAASILGVAGMSATCGVDGTVQENGMAPRTLESVEAPQSETILRSAPKKHNESSTAHVHSALSSDVPKEFSTYASVPIGDNLRCTTGAVTDEDGMNQRPYVYVSSTSGDNVKWVKALDMPEGFYESRATHCLLKGDVLYVLLQSDTQSQQALSQTLLKVVKVNSSDGTVTGSVDVVIPGVKGAYSAWVRKGEENFRQVNDEMLITGQYRLVDTGDPIPFHISVKK
ncbi:MAG TPA: hypothetical protein VL997_06365 [Dyella sp.]|nr:hypothetical protein [Dyella sp.]